jgi:hypothetical protein
VRFLVREGLRGIDVPPILGAMAARPGYHFWADGLSYREAQLDGVTGHQQVTDSYLASLAPSQSDSVLATLDRRQTSAHRDVTLMIP